MSDIPDLPAELHRLADFHERKSQYAKTVHALRQAAAEVESLRDELAENEQLMIGFRSSRNRAEDRAETAEAEVESLRDDNQAWAVRWQEQYDRAERLAHQAGDRP